MNYLFVDQLLKTADEHREKPAIHINNQLYTYGEFYDMVFSLAALFKKCNPIGIMDNSDFLSYAAVVASLISGKTYVPLNPFFPAERNRFIIEECGLKFIFDSESRFKGNGVSVIIPEQMHLVKNNEGYLSPIAYEGTIAYILFTSGSTGEPKGVPVSYESLACFFEFFLNKGGYGFDTKDRFLQMYDLTFDVSVFSFIIPLLSGASLFVVPKNKPGYLAIAETMSRHKITVSSMVPSVLNFLEPYLNELKFTSLRLSFFSGDILWHNMAMRWLKCIPNAQLHNFYGPTETTIVCTHYCFDESRIPEKNGIVPIGLPFPGMEYCIINERGEQRVDKVPGELCFSGKQVIPSYLGGKYGEKFITIKHAGEFKRFYCTGDLVSEGSDGNLLFHGRTDRQVKINGYRVELQEIESCISRFSGGKMNAVIKHTTNGLDRLIAFIAPHVDTESLNSYLRKQLPTYMIPEKLICLDRIPTNRNGKINYTELIEYNLPQQISMDQENQRSSVKKS